MSTETKPQEINWICIVINGVMKLMHINGIDVALTVSKALVTVIS